MVLLRILACGAVGIPNSFFKKQNRGVLLIQPYIEIFDRTNFFRSISTKENEWRTQFYCILTFKKVISIPRYHILWVSEPSHDDNFLMVESFLDHQYKFQYTQKGRIWWWHEKLMKFIFEHEKWTFVISVILQYICVKTTEIMSISVNLSMNKTIKFPYFWVIFVVFSGIFVVSRGIL